MKKLNKILKKYRVFLILGIFALISIPIFAFAAKTPTLSLDVASEVHRGDEIELKVNLSDTDAWNGIGYSIYYDTDKLEFADVTVHDGGGIIATAGAIDGGIKFGFAFTPNPLKKQYNTDYNGELATITFKVKEGAVGTCDFQVQVLEFYKDPDGNGNFESLTNKTVNAQTTIVVPATGFTVESESIVMLNGDTKKINLTVEPEGATTEANANYSVTKGNSVAVSNDGTITTKGNGESTITINAYGFTKTITVNVINPVEAINFDVTSLKLNKNDTRKINATLVPHNKDAEPTGNTTIKWTSSNEGVASVGPDGTVTAKKGGTTTIKAEIIDGNTTISKECTVNVEVPITNVTINKTSLKLIIDSAAPEKATETLVLNVEPSDAYPKNITWSTKDSSVATVNNGVVTAVGAGTTTITAKVGTYTRDVKVDVIIPIKSLELSDETIEMLPNQNKNLDLTINPSNTTEKDKIKWESSEPDVVKVDANGKIEALKAGTAVITVKVENPEYADLNLTDKVTVKVLIPVENVYIVPDATIKMNKGNTETLGIRTYPEAGEGVQKVTVTWESSDTNIVTVDKNTGKVTAVGTGKTTVVGTVSNGSKVTATITVENPITSVAFDKKSTKIELGKTENLKLTINPEDYYYETPQKIEWSSDNNSIAMVDANGVVTAKGTGTTTINATIAGKTATITVTVYIPITGIEIKSDTSVIEIERGNSKTLTAVITPENTTESKEIKWSSSNTKVATVDDNGIVTAVGAGTTTITATASNGMTATKEVKVVILIKDFTVSKTEMTIYKGAVNAQTISTTITPADTTESKVITWKSSDESVATVDENGKVTGLKAGTTTISGYLANGLHVDVKVTVEIIPLTDIKVHFEDEILKGKEYTIDIEPVPANSTELENVTYASSDEKVLTVSEDGVVKGIAAGTAKITIKVGDITKEIEVTVKEIKAKSITAVVPSTTLEIGQEADIQMQMNPIDSTDELTYTYKSSDEKILTVSENGTIKAVGAGTATITVTASNGLTTTLTMTIKGISPNPQTGLESYVLYLIISIISLLSIVFVGYSKKRLVK